jgi:hypothetical protein
VPVRLDKNIICITGVDEITNRDADFFRNFTHGASFHRLAEFEMTARQLPAFLAASIDASAQQKAAVFPHHYAYTDSRPVAA